MSSEPGNKAVFLSYASQDAEAARRICEALREAGVEVWFDQSELRGGDVWDRKIRRQIADCALFVPIISANTQARLEGYFRLEWKLAEDRSHLMAKGKPFLVPVVVDTTSERDAHVPDAFLAVQWTRLPGGETSAAFCDQVRRLLGGSGLEPGRPRPGERGEGTASPVVQPARPRVPVAAWGVVGAVLAITLAALGWLQLRKAVPEGAPEKTLAVLPFVTGKADSDDEKLSDGIADELLTQLGRTPGLRVSGRTSSFSFRGQKLTDAEVARKLDVAYLVAGTFEKNGSQVRVRPQLINAADGSILWGATFTKELTNVFALQDEIAGLIAQQLQLKLSPAARAKRTVDPVAYGLVQKGRHLWLKRSDEALAEAVASYEEAIRVDPNYAEAHSGLADAALVRGWYMELEGENQSGRFYARAREAAMQALKLDPALAEPHATLGGLNMNQGRFDEAEREFQEALRLNPNYSYAHHWRAHLLAAQGQIDEAVIAMERATQIDPFSLSALVIRAVMLAHTARHAQAVAVADQAMAVRQNAFLPADGTRALSLLMIGRREEAVAAARVITKDVTIKPRWWIDGSAIYVLRKAGHEEEARTHGERMLAAWPGNDYVRIYVAVGMGKVDETLDVLLRSPVPPTSHASVYYSEIWEEVRQSPRFPEVMKKLNCWEHYERGRLTKARMQAADAARK